MLSHWKLEIPAAKRNVAKGEVKEISEETLMGGIRGKKNQFDDEPQLFPVASDATTYEALVKSLALCLRRINYNQLNVTTGANEIKAYAHSSSAFALEELASLFRKKTEDTVNFLHQTYDCGDYRYETVTRGKDCIKNSCVNLLAGSTPDFMQQIFKDELINQGFSSRAMFIFASANRFRRLRISEFTQEQLAAREDVLNHIKKLSTLYGEVAFSDEAMAYLENWWEVESLTKQRPNTSIKLDAYYERKQIHVIKLAIGIHFSEIVFDAAGKCSMVIQIQSCIRARLILDNAEKGMHLALNLNSENPLHKLSKKIHKFMTTVDKDGLTGLKFNNIFAEFFDSGNKEQLEDTMEYLIAVGKVRFENQRYYVMTDDIPVAPKDIPIVPITTTTESLMT